MYFSIYCCTKTNRQLAGQKRVLLQYIYGVRLLLLQTGEVQNGIYSYACIFSSFGFDARWYKELGVLPYAGS